MRTALKGFPLPFRVAYSAIWAKREPVIGGGRTSTPEATARIVRRRSSSVASLRMNPETPACTNSTMSACTGTRSMMINRASGTSRFTNSTTCRLL